MMYKEGVVVYLKRVQIYVEETRKSQEPVFEPTHKPALTISKT